MTSSTTRRTIIRPAHTINPGETVRIDGIEVAVTSVHRDHDRGHVTLTTSYGAPRTVTWDAAVPVPTDTIHLIGIGDVPAVPLSEVVPGDRLTWNYGQTYEVVRNVQVAPQTWELTERCLEGATGETGREYTRRKRGATLVARTHRNGDPDPRAAAVQRRIERYAGKFNAETVSYEPPDPREPTDANLAAVLDRCVRPARPDEYPAIRDAVLRQRAELASV